MSQHRSSGDRRRETEPQPTAPARALTISSAPVCRCTSHWLACSRLRRPTARCCCSAKRERARNCSRGPFTHTAGGMRQQPRERQLRRAPADTHRKRALRSRARCIYRRVGRSTGPVRTGTPRHDLPGRDRRLPAGASGETAACPAERGVRARRLLAHAKGRRPHHRRDASPSRRQGCHGRVSRGSVLSAERVSHPIAAASRASRRHSRARMGIHSEAAAGDRTLDHARAGRL